jgi:hypothetical protein
MMVGTTYTFTVNARVSPSLRAAVGLQLVAQNATLCSSRVVGCGLGDLLVLGRENATATWSALTMSFAAPVNTTVVYLRQAAPGLLWLDDATLQWLGVLSSLMCGDHRNEL